MPKLNVLEPNALNRARIRSLVPHRGAMCLLDSVLRWSEDAIACTAVSHLDPANPLRSDGRLAALCGAEYAMQATALHGALLAGGLPQPAGYLAALRDLELHVSRLDDPAHGTLTVEAHRERQDAAGLIYAVAVRAEDGTPLLRARGTVVLPRPGA